MSGSTALTETIDERALAKYVRFLVGSFRVGEAEDAEVLTRGLTALLGSYPEFVVRAVCDPRSGLPATAKFFPTLFEVRVACDAKMRPVLDAERRKRLEEANAADRPEEVTDAAADRRRAFIADWRAKQILREAETAKVETSLADLDARHLKGDHKEIVQKAIEAKIARLTEQSHSTPLRLSEEAFATTSVAFLSLFPSQREEGMAG